MARPEQPTELAPELEAEHLAEVQRAAEHLCDTVQAAEAAGVSSALLLPRLLAVFQAAGMLPDLDFGSLLGMLR